MAYLSLAVELADIPRTGKIVAWCRALDREGTVVQSELFTSTTGNAEHLAAEVQEWIRRACIVTLP